MDLALGTAQFGLAYGVAGRHAPVPRTEVRQILARAWSFGIRTLDTASAYGDIERDLAGLCGDREFRIVSKIPKPAPSLDAQAAGRWLVEQAEQSRKRLSPLLQGLLLHDASVLEDPRAPVAWSALAAWSDASGVSVGASTYDPAALARHLRLPGYRLAQVPANALDQRVADLDARLDQLEIHVRSVFLQGLLLMDAPTATDRLPQCAVAVTAWQSWCTARGLEPIEAALSIAKGLPLVRACVVGVDSLEQLEQLAAAWARARPMTAPELRCDDARVIDPRTWSPG